MGNDKILKFWRRIGQSRAVIDYDGFFVQSGGDAHPDPAFAEFVAGNGKTGYIFPVTSDTDGYVDEAIISHGPVWCSSSIKWGSHGQYCGNNT